MLLTSCVYAIFTLSDILCMFCKQYRIVRVSLAPRSSCESIPRWYHNSLDLQTKSIVFELLLDTFFQIDSSVFIVGKISNLSPRAQEKMDQTHVLLTPFNYFEWKA